MLPLVIFRLTRQRRTPGSKSNLTNVHRPKTLLVTGSAGLIGSEVVEYFCALGWKVHGLDNNMRADFLGPTADTRWNAERLRRTHAEYHHHDVDIRDRAAVMDSVRTLLPDLLVHAAAQPSHDLSFARPLETYDVNSTGTVNLLEAVRTHVPATPFVNLSTNKVYGDLPNGIPMVELPTRWDYVDERYSDGIPESFPIDQSTHSIFGASKVAADVMVQEYGRYFGLLTCCLRGGCLTGGNHSAVELHGFLNYLIRCNVEGRHYTVFGYKGKQVRDNIHAYDVATFIHAFYLNPRVAEVYNLGGGRENSCSLLEAFAKVEALTGRPMQYTYLDEPRVGDHICYISDLSKAKRDYPEWGIRRSLDDIFEETVQTFVAGRELPGGPPDALVSEESRP